MILYLVSYRLRGWFMGGCGNQSFKTLPEAEQYAEENKHDWISYGIGWFGEDGILHLIPETQPVTT